MRLSKFLTILAVALTAAVSSTATAQLQPKSGIEPHLFDRTGRDRDQVVTQVRTLATQSGLYCTQTATNAVAPAVVSTSLLTNVAGYMVSSVGAASLTGWTITTSIAPMAYAGKVQVHISDGGSASTPICQYLQICGDLWNGSPYCETTDGTGASTTIVGETVTRITAASFSRITRVRLASCSSVDVGDTLFIRQSNHIAFKYRISATPTNDVLSVCAYQQMPTTALNAAMRCVPASQLAIDSSLIGNSVNILDADFRVGASFNQCLPENSTIQIWYRATPYGTTY
jgi:hypothetical protein